MARAHGGACVVSWLDVQWGGWLRFCVFWVFFGPPPQAAVEEGIVIGGGCTLLKLAAKVDAIKGTLSNEEQKVRQWWWWWWQ